LSTCKIVKREITAEQGCLASIFWQVGATGSHINLTAPINHFLGAKLLSTMSTFYKIAL